MKRPRRSFKRRATRRRFTRRRRTGINGGLLARRFDRFRREIVPYTYAVAMKFCLDGTASPSSSQSFDYAFLSGNGPFKPVVASTTHQPMGWDQWSLLYNAYYVVSSRIRVVFSQATTAATSVYVGIIPQVDLSVPTNYTNLIEQPQSHWKAVGEDISGKSIVTVTHAASTKKVLHIRDLSDNVNQVSAVTSNPTQLWYWLIFAKANGTETPGQIIQQIEIEYNVVFLDPRTQQQS